MGLFELFLHLLGLIFFSLDGCIDGPASVVVAVVAVGVVEGFALFVVCELLTSS
jgi:hypothetical protein